MITQAIKEVVDLLFYLTSHAQHFPFETLYKRGRLKVEDFSQLFLYGLLYIETCSLRKHCKNHSDQFMSYSK